MGKKNVITEERLQHGAGRVKNELLRRTCAALKLDTSSAEAGSPKVSLQSPSVSSYPDIVAVLCAVRVSKLMSLSLVHQMLGHEMLAPQTLTHQNLV